VVPTARGLSLWSAYNQADNQIAELKELPPGDAEGFEKGWQQREWLVEQFPSFAKEIHEVEEEWIEQSTKKWEDDLARLEEGKRETFEALRGGYKNFLANQRFQAQRLRLDNAEQAWIERSVKKWGRDLGDLKAAGEDDFAALDRLRKRYEPYWDNFNSSLESAEMDWVRRGYEKDLKPGDIEAVRSLRKRYRNGWKTLYNDKLHAWEEDWVRRTVTQTDEEVKDLIETAPEKALKRLTGVAQTIKELGEYKHQQTRLTLKRGKALQGVVDVLRGKLVTLIKRRQYQELAERARKFEEEYRKDAADVGMQKLLTDIRDFGDFFAMLDRQVAVDGARQLLGLSCSPPTASPASLAIAVWMSAPQGQPR
jgi:hypothetical protein